VFARSDYQQLAELTGESLAGHFSADVPTIGNSGDGFLFLDQFARNALRPLRAAWEEHASETNWFRLLRFVKAYGNLRSRLMSLDFTDMLEQYVSSGLHAAGVDVDFAVIDEAQDLTPLQWQVARRAFGRVPEVVIAGDDDQSIFTWAGADGTALLRFSGVKAVLSQSYRLPRVVFDLANRVVNQIRRRNPKVWHPANHSGSVNWLNRADAIDLRNGEEWLLLARTRAQLPQLVALARSQGAHYAVMGTPSVAPELVHRILEHEAGCRAGSGLPIWHEYFTDIPVSEREYLISCLRAREKLTNVQPRVRIETVHGAKGQQAPNVGFLTDFSERVRRGMMADRDAELRVLYVALTRASRNLFLVNPMRKHYGYTI
jgi:superfamily I DNA/RNA helicase